jgi:hypothetical protein
VLRDSAVRATARNRRRVGLVAVVVCALGTCAPGAAAQQRTTSNPEELWRAYPLEQAPTTGTGAQSRPPASEGRTDATSTATEGSGSGTAWIGVLAAVAAAGAICVALVAAARHRRRTASAHDAAPEPASEAPRPPHDLLWRANWPVSTPPRRAPPKPARAAGAPASPDAPACQIRWSPSGGFFVAVRTDPDGAERGIARSPRFDWAGPTPPEQEAEVEAALRVLAKELRDKGWRPLRAKGFDFDERRWYARRFRWPTEAEADRPGGGADDDTTKGRRDERSSRAATRRG